MRMGKKYMKRCSTSFVLREMQSKATMRYTPIRMVKTKKTEITKY